MGSLKPTDLVPIGARKGTFDMTEQFAFQQTFGQSRAIYRHKRSLGPRSAVVQCSGDDLLTGTAFTGN